MFFPIGFLFGLMFAYALDLVLIIVVSHGCVATIKLQPYMLVLLYLTPEHVVPWDHVDP